MKKHDRPNGLMRFFIICINQKTNLKKYQKGSIQMLTRIVYLISGCETHNKKYQIRN